MAYKLETIRKAIKGMNDCMNHYRAIYAADEFKTFCDISISTGNKKIGRVMNVSLAPILTCANCKECMHLCYDIKAVVQYGNVRKARAKNTVLALEHETRYFQAIRYALGKRRKNKYFRWHVGGDIPNYSYFENMVQIAKERPDFIFWTYTKNYFIVNEYCDRNGKDAIPSNLTIMFSEWDGMKMINPYHFPEFSCKLKDGNKNHSPKYFETLYRCPGNCDICKAAHRGCIAGETTYALEH